MSPFFLGAILVGTALESVFANSTTLKSLQKQWAWGEAQEALV